MTLFEIYKSRKDALVTRIRESKSLYETGSVIAEAFETMQFQYLSQPENNGMSEKLTDYISMAKTTFPLLESVNKYKLWENAEAKQPKKKSPLPGFITLLIGITLIFGAVAMAMFANKIDVADIKNIVYYAGAMAAGCLFILIAGFMLFFRRKVKMKATVEISVDADDIVKRLEDVVKNIDALLEKDKKEKAQYDQMIESAINREEAQLFSYLLEAKLSDQPDFAMEQLDEVESYLAKQDVMIVKYIKGNEKYFDFLEGEETKTIRPALVRGGKMLAKGLAQLKYGEEI
jgi:hypothetical protein